MPSPRRASAGRSAGRRALCAPHRCGRSSERRPARAPLRPVRLGARRRLCRGVVAAARRLTTLPPVGRSLSQSARAPEPPPAARRCRAARPGRLRAAGEQRSAADLRLAWPERPGTRPQTAPRRSAALDGRELGADFTKRFNVKVTMVAPRVGAEVRERRCRRRARRPGDADRAHRSEARREARPDADRQPQADRAAVRRSAVRSRRGLRRAQGLHGGRLRAGRPGRGRRSLDMGRVLRPRVDLPGSGGGAQRPRDRHRCGARRGRP